MIISKYNNDVIEFLNNLSKEFKIVYKNNIAIVHHGSKLNPIETIVSLNEQKEGYIDNLKEFIYLKEKK